MQIDLAFAFGLVVTAMLVALSSLTAITAFSGKVREKTASIFGESTPGTVFLFDGEALVDSTPAARNLLATAVDSGGPWFRVVSLLEPLFPGLTLRLEGLAREGRFVLCSREDMDPPLVLRVESVGGITRLTLLDADTEQRQPGRDGAADVALHEELTMIRDTIAKAPVLIWRERGPDRQVVWANGAYLLTAAQALEPGKEMTWPLPQVFALETAPVAGSVRKSVRIADQQLWYEISSMPAGDETIFYALPANKLVQAEVSLREFMQTLTKTFAQLPIGLAIFDRNRVLQLFNPALLDLTTLQPEFLVSRPTLPIFLDAMRDHAMIPEPKDYRSWRKQMLALEEAAASGLFEETWSLPTGQTFRVTGRPHPNGALAFLFEDISNEIMRTRRYRADLELGQAVIDAMDSAIAVFSVDGHLVMSNRAYARLWQHSPAELISEQGKPAAIETWRSQSAPTLLWNDLAEYIGAMGDREAWDGEIRLLDGRLVTCRISPIPHGSTLVSFAVQARQVALDDAGAAQAVMIA